MDKGETIDGKYYEAVKRGGISERALILARDRIYWDLIALTKLVSGQKVIDVGVSDVISDGANLLERKYPHPSDITACGLGAAGDFISAFPDVTYVQIEANHPLPFPDGMFDIATSNAVLEHVGSERAQFEFVRELDRVARKVFISVPNSLFPIEHHTGLPVVHYSATLFKYACRLFGKNGWADEKNLILMSKSRLRRLAPSGRHVVLGETGIRLGPFSSNLYLFVERGRQ
jgi:ubiquinone/menaquinone biosynthesis C-methylase UbiE